MQRHQADEEELLLAVDTDQKGVPDAVHEAPEGIISFLSHELPTVLPVMGPLVMRGLGQYSLNLVAMKFVNVHAPKHLAGVSLGMTLTTMLGWAAISGQSNALVTLTSQLHGTCDAAELSRKTQAYVNVSAFIHVVWIAVPLLLLPFIHMMLLGLGQSPEVAYDATMYLGLSLLTLPAYAVYVSHRRYLDALLRPWPGALLCGSGVVLLSLFLPMMNSIGVPAQHTPPVSLFVLFLVFALFLLKYVGPVHSFGTIPSKRKLKRYTSLAIPAMLSMMSEWWSTEVLVVLAARVGTASLTANAVTNTLLTFLNQISFAVNSSCSARVGYWLGAGHPKKAQRTILMHIVIVLCFTAVTGHIMRAFKSTIAFALVGNSNEETVQITETLITIISYFFVATSIQCCFNGAMCGLGKQKITMYASILAYWPIGLPISAYCGFTLEMGVVGFWVGLTVCTLVGANQALDHISNFSLISPPNYHFTIQHSAGWRL